MKKTLLTLAAALMFGGSALADTVTLTPKDQLGSSTLSGITEWKANDDFTFTFDKGSGSTATGFNKAGDVRLYAGNTATLTATEGITIQSVVFNLSSQGKSRLGEVTANVGTIATQSKGDETVTWTGDASSVTFTADPNNQKNQYGTGSSAACQICFDSVVITYSADTSGKKPAELSFDTTTLNVGTGVVQFPTLNNPNNLAVTYTSSDDAVAVVNDFGGGFVTLQAKGLGTATITATSAETEEFAAGKASFTINVVQSATTIPQMLILAPDNGNEILVKGNFTVAYQGINNSKNTYVYLTDYLGNATLVYAAGSVLNFKKGDVIPNGWIAKRSDYKGLVEWTGTLPEATDCYPDEVVYSEMTEVTILDMNKIVTLKGVVFTEATPTANNTNFNGTVGENVYTFRNTFGIESTEAGQYDVVCAVSYYDGTIQILPIEYNEYVKNPEFPNTFTLTSDNEMAYNLVAADDPANEYGMPLLDITLTIDDTQKEASFSIAVPEGWDSVYSFWETDNVDNGINPLNVRRAAAEWMDPSLMGLKEGNNFIVTYDPAYTETIGQIFLGFNGKVDAANRVVASVKFDIQTGVDAVEAADEAPVYYDLNGVQVANPEAGLYIVVRGNKVSKEIVK